MLASNLANLTDNWICCYGVKEIIQDVPFATIKFFAVILSLRRAAAASQTLLEENDRVCGVNESRRPLIVVKRPQLRHQSASEATGLSGCAWTFRSIFALMYRSFILNYFECVVTFLF